MGLTLAGRCLWLGAALAAVALGGCGSDPYKTVPVRGRVLCDGKPAWGGTVIFHPLDEPGKTGRPAGSPGRAASALIREDGTFSLSVPAAAGGKDQEGALLGPHRVTFVLPKSTPWEWDPADDWLSPEEQEKLKAELAQRPVYPELPCGTAISPDEVEVMPGVNEFEFTLQVGTQVAAGR